MTKEFDERNMAKSRRVCAAMEEVANSMRRCGEVRNSCDITAKSTAKPDNVSHPAHYTGGGIEAKDALKAAMDGSELSPMASYWWGCAFKYLWRWTSKNGIEDLRKCRQCIDFLIEEVGE
jgi:hypothetical protein